MIKIEKDDEFNKNDKKFVSLIEVIIKFVRIKMISSIEIDKLTKSVI